MPGTPAAATQTVKLLENIRSYCCSSKMGAR